MDYLETDKGVDAKRVAILGVSRLGKTVLWAGASDPRFADVWSDPKGEFLAAVAAAPVFQLLGKQALDAEQMPPAGQPILSTLGYAMRAGGHGTIPSDWELFLKFMQMHLQPGK
jgi:hypothetical protein